MADEIVFYTNPMSRGRVIRWMLEEIGEPYRTEVLDYPAMKGPDYRAINPMGKVPAITHRGQTITECAAICAYLADAFPDAKLAPPPGDPARGPYYRWLFYTAGPFEAAITDRSLGLGEVPKEKRGMVGYGTFDQVLDTLETALTGKEYLAGDRFSAADLYVGAQLRFQTMFRTIEPRPAFTAYVDRLDQRPAYKRAQETDNALLPEDRRM